MIALACEKCGSEAEGWKVETEEKPPKPWWKRHEKEIVVGGALAVAVGYVASR